MEKHYSEEKPKMLKVLGATKTNYRSGVIVEISVYFTWGVEYDDVEKLWSYYSETDSFRWNAKEETISELRDRVRERYSELSTQDTSWVDLLDKIKHYEVEHP